MSQSTGAKRARGRPRNEVGIRRALEAARDILLAEGFGRLTMEAVAARSGVSKPTLYRHWANAQELAMAALLPPAAAADPAGPTARARLVSHIESLIEVFATTRGRQIARTLASADPDSEYTRAFRNRVILASRENGRAILREAVAAGEIGAPADEEALLDMLYGPVFYRLFMGHQPLERALAKTLVELTWRG
ncbi:MAG: TetR/AcrR family transcriptional regulator [Sphingomonas sp.]|nr:TetR/AcrR family transcriptional regulator [Sphingomonas sp.]